MARYVGTKKSGTMTTDRIVAGRLRLKEDTWGMIATLTVTSGLSAGEFLEPLIENAYRDWVKTEVRRLRI